MDKKCIKTYLCALADSSIDPVLVLQVEAGQTTDFGPLREFEFSPSCSCGSSSGLDGVVASLSTPLSNMFKFFNFSEKIPFDLTN